MSDILRQIEATKREEIAEAKRAVPEAEMRRRAEAGLPVRAAFGDFYRDFEWMGLQRHLKVLGIVARLSHRDGKDRYLADLPLVLRYVQEVAARYVTLAPLSRLIDRIEGRSQRIGHTF